MIVRDYGSYYLYVYTKIHPFKEVIAFAPEGTIIKEYSEGEVIKLFNKEMVMTKYGPLYRPQREFLEELLSRVDPKEYRVDLTRKYVLYTINGIKLQLWKKKKAIFSEPFKDLSEVLDVFLKKREPAIPKDFLMSSARIEGDGLHKNVYPKDVGVFFPSKYLIDSKRWTYGYYSIRTPEGYKRIPIAPVFLNLKPEFMKIKEYFENTSSYKYAPFIVPGVETRTNYGLYYYKSSNEWRAKTNDGRKIMRSGDDWFSCAGGNYNEYESNFGKITINERLPTGQTALYVVRKNDTARLYGVITPEGMFVIDVPLERLEKPEPISVFENGVKLVGTFFVFPIRIMFSEASTTVKFYGRWYIHAIEIDGVAVTQKKSGSYVISTSTGEKIAKQLGVTMKNADVVMNIGLT